MRRLPLYHQDRVKLLTLLQFAQSQLVQLAGAHRHTAISASDLFIRHASQCADLMARLHGVKPARPPPQ